MNSITYLDSILTRSLTPSRSNSRSGSRSGSGANTPSLANSTGASESSTPLGHSGQQLNRRASDYSLAREREREKRKIAASLGLTSIDGTTPRSSRPKSSRKGSNSSIHSIADEKQQEASHVKSHSEPHALDEQHRQRLIRAETSPSPIHSAPINRSWTSLWGLGGIVEARVPPVTAPLPQTPSTRGRRASTSDADAATSGFAPGALLSEREREDVVDFEGYDPEDDIVPLPEAPPSTPHQSVAAATSTTSPPATATSSRLSSLLFGALNPLTDDYFGPQAAARQNAARKRRASEASEKKRKTAAAGTGRSRRASQASYDSQSDASSSGQDHEKSVAGASVEATMADPPPPYTSTTSIGEHDDETAAELAIKPGNSAFAMAIQKVLNALKRFVLAILLAPYRLHQFGKHSAKQRQAMATQAVSIPVEQTSLAARMDPHATDSESEVATEDQAMARAQRKMQLQEAATAAAAAAEEKQSAMTSLRPRASSRLLPNPHPVDPLLAHDRNAKALLEKQAAAAAAAASTTTTDFNRQAGRLAVVNRGPSSSLIHHSPKVLVLDLDETLIHSTSRSPTWSALADKSKSRLAVTTGGSLLGLEGLGGVFGLRGQVGVRPHQVEVVLDGRSIIYHVYKRPHVDTFLRKVASWYHVVVFTASVQEYADPVIDWLDQGRGLISARLFRESCTFRNGSYYKNLTFVDADLSRICLVDNSPASYAINQANGIPIEGWTHDPTDECLLDLLPILDSLRFASDVRHILGIRGFAETATTGGGK